MRHLLRSVVSLGSLTGIIALVACSDGSITPNLVQPELAASQGVGTPSPRAAVTIETVLDLTSVPLSGTFEVVEGAADLGCSAGTFVDHPVAGAPAPSTIEKAFTCTSDGDGTFTVLFRPNLNRPGPGVANGQWSVLTSTGDFVDLHGSGEFSVVPLALAPPTLQETLEGAIHYAP